LKSGDYTHNRIAGEIAIYRQLIDCSGRAESTRLPSPLNPGVERKRQFVLVAPMFQDSSVGIDRRDVESSLNILPVDDLVSISCNHNYALHFSVPNDRCDIRLNCVSLERGHLLCITRSQVFLDDVFNFFNGSWLPFFHLSQFSHPRAQLSRTGVYTQKPTSAPLCHLLHPGIYHLPTINPQSAKSALAASASLPGQTANAAPDHHRGPRVDSWAASLPILIRVYL
jgi:hypothetical protein